MCEILKARLSAELPKPTTATRCRRSAPIRASRGMRGCAAALPRSSTCLRHKQHTSYCRCAIVGSVQYTEYSTQTQVQTPQISIIIMAQENNLYLMSCFAPNINQVVLNLISKFLTECIRR